MTAPPQSEVVKDDKRTFLMAKKTNGLLTLVVRRKKPTSKGRLIIYRLVAYRLVATTAVATITTLVVAATATAVAAAATAL